MKSRRNNIKILQITKNKFPPEIRLVKEGLSLLEAGYKSAVLCPPVGDQPEYEVWNGIEIFRPKILWRRSAIDKLLEYITFFSPNWYRAICYMTAKYRPDVLHVHDIWLGRSAFAARTTQRLVLDLHENMPAAVFEYRKGHRGLRYWFYSLFHNRRRILVYERGLLEKSDLVLVVVQEARERVLVNHPTLNSQHVINVENLESKRFVAEPVGGLPAFGKDHFSVLYIGGFGPHRGIDTLIRAMQLIKQNGHNVKIQLIGAQSSQYLDMLKQLIAELGVKDHIGVTGWVNAEDVLANIRQANVCCVPHHSNPHTDSTIPHKLFQYMIAKRPVLVSSSAPLARSVRQANAGMIFGAGDHQDCARKILTMADDQGACDQFAENGFRYVMEQGHNWEEESAPHLVAAYDRLLNVF